MGAGEDEGVRDGEKLHYIITDNYNSGVRKAEVLPRLLKERSLAYFVQDNGEKEFYLPHELKGYKKPELASFPAQG